MTHCLLARLSRGFETVDRWQLTVWRPFVIDRDQLDCIIIKNGEFGITWTTLPRKTVLHEPKTISKISSFPLLGWEKSSAEEIENGGKVVFENDFVFFLGRNRGTDDLLHVWLCQLCLDRICRESLPNDDWQWRGCSENYSGKSPGSEYESFSSNGTAMSKSRKKINIYTYINK